MDNERNTQNQPQKKYRVWFGILFCVFLLLITGILSLRTGWLKNIALSASSPLQEYFMSLSEWVRDHTENWGTLQQAVERNQELEESIASLEAENRNLQSQAARVSELEDLLELKTYYRDYPTTAAQIVGLSEDNWVDTFILDKGSADGIEEYMPVLSSYGLAGHISEVYENYSVVSSVVEQGGVVYGQVNRQDGDLVVVQGGHGVHVDGLGTQEGICLINFVSSEVDITVGDEIVTSTLGDIYPPGLSIGTVTDIVSVGTGYESVAIVEPTAPLEQTDMVLIITELWKEDLKDSSGQEETQ